MAKTWQASAKVEKKKCRKRLRSRSRSGSRERREPPVGLAPLEQEVVDTKQFSVKFEDQKECEVKARPAEFIRCHNCEAILTSQSLILPESEYVKLKLQSNKSDELSQKFLDVGGRVWICEFCMAHNPLPDSFKPAEEDNPCFLLSEAHSKMELEEAGQILIFCIDISGSMEMEVVGRKNRLNCVVEAVVDEIRKMKLDQSQKKVGVILFGSDVYVIGDGDLKQAKVPQALFSKFEGLTSNAANYLPHFSKSVSDSYDKLLNTVQKTICHGSTALGPALVTAIEVASKGSPGSRVVICTDGEANMGVGSGQDSSFYDSLADYAKNKGVNVSVLTIKGDRCNVKMLGKVSLATGGSVMKVNPDALGSEFSKVVSDEVVGTDADLVLRLNHRFKFKEARKELLADHERLLRDKLGNFTSETELAYHFDIITEDQNKTLKIVNNLLFKSTRLPIQLQLTYTGSNSNRYLQVFTDWREVTENEDELVESADFGVLAASIRQLVSRKIRDGEFEAAKLAIQRFDKLCANNFGKVEGLAPEIQEHTQQIRQLEKVLKRKWRKSLKPGVPVPEYLTIEEKEKAKRSRSGSRSRSRSGGRFAPNPDQGRGGRGGGRGWRGGFRGRRSRSRSRSGSPDRRDKDRDRQRDRKSRRRRSRSRSMSSDSEEQVLYKEMKAKAKKKDKKEK